MVNIKDNPLLWEARVGKYNAIPFDKIKLEHFIPAIEEGIRITYEKIKKIKDNTAEPDFENTVLALDSSDDFLEEVACVYFNLMNAESDDEFKSLAQQIGPMLSQLHNEINMDPVIFEKYKKVYEKREILHLNQEEKRLLEINYKSFVRNGALLSEADKKRVKEIDIELAKISPKYVQNVMASTNDFQLHITDKEQLKGLPESALQAAAFLAEKNNKEGWLFNLQIPSIQPILEYAENRELRKKIGKAYGSRAFNNKFDNQDFIKKIVKLRYERAKILGFKSHAHYVLEERMAKSPENVHKFTEDLLSVTMPFAQKDVEEIKKTAKKLDGLDEIYSYDSSYYSNKIKKEKFHFEEEDVKPYFKVENVVAGVFKIANKLYDLNFKELFNIPVYHEDVKIYEVTNDKNNFVGLLYLDLFPRETKRNGAWMTTYFSQGLHHGKIHRPHVSIVANLTPSTDEMPSLLKLNEVRTLFHEFGHALHSLLSDCKFTSLASPNVYWDFVELPSQIMENWSIEKEGLDIFAEHYETGEKIPDELVEKIKIVNNFQAGLQNIRQLSFVILDMSYHSVDPKNIENVRDHEIKVMEKVRLFPVDTEKNISCSFSHIFAGGYSSGYYSYKWAEVLEADAFELFKEKGIFDKETATSFRDNILSRGNTEPPMDIYIKFRGRKPDSNALLRKSGLQ